jgi:hypothetical protein
MRVTWEIGDRSTDFVCSPTALLSHRSQLNRERVTTRHKGLDECEQCREKLPLPVAAEKIQSISQLQHGIDNLERQRIAARPPTKGEANLEIGKKNSIPVRKRNRARMVFQFDKKRRSLRYFLSKEVRSSQMTQNESLRHFKLLLTLTG